MKVVNYNESIRQSIVDCDLSDIYDLYNGAKNDDFYPKYVVGVLYETAYMVSCGLLKLYPNDEDSLQDKKYFEAFESVDDFIFIMDEDMFFDLLDAVHYFESLNLYSKRIFIESTLKDEKVMSFFPCFLLDAFSFLNKYDASVIVDEYSERLKGNKEAAFSDSVSAAIEGLILLEKEDFDAYRYVILDMVCDYYIYYNYLLLTGKIEDSYESDLVKMIEDDLNSMVGFSIGNISLLQTLINGYLTYKLLNKNQLDEISCFYKNSKNNDKVIKLVNKTKRLKNEI